MYIANFPSSLIQTKKKSVPEARCASVVAQKPTLMGQNLDRNYRNRNIYILSDSQAAIKALGKHQIASKLVWDCRQSLIQLAQHNRVQLIWVPGHECIDGS
jgi:hypothetical protein